MWIAIKDLNLSQAVIKAQVHAGGRGKAGGVKFGQSQQEILERVEQMIGMKLITHQTGEEGITVEQVMISQPVDIAHVHKL